MIYREVTTYEHYTLTKSLIENDIERGDENSMYPEREKHSENWVVGSCR